jgi:hypothetical protein
MGIAVLIFRHLNIPARYRRLKIEGEAFFCTLALADRGSDLLVRHIERLRHTFPASHHSLNHLLPLCSA